MSNPSRCPTKHPKGHFTPKRTFSTEKNRKGAIEKDFIYDITIYIWLFDTEKKVLTPKMGHQYCRRLHKYEFIRNIEQMWKN